MNEASYFLCWAEERRVQMSATMTTTTTVTAPTETTMMTRRLLFFWGVALPWGGRIWPMGESEIQKTKEEENIKYKTQNKKWILLDLVSLLILDSFFCSFYTFIFRIVRSIMVDFERFHKSGWRIHWNQAKIRTWLKSTFKTQLSFIF